MKTTNEIDDATVQQLVLVTGGHWVPREFCDAVRLQIEEIIPAMTRGVPYTIEVMCGSEFWSQLSKPDYERQEAGRCVARMVQRGELPLEFAGRTPANATLYRLK